MSDLKCYIFKPEGEHEEKSFCCWEEAKHHAFDRVKEICKEYPHREFFMDMRRRGRSVIISAKLDLGIKVWERITDDWS